MTNEADKNLTNFMKLVRYKQYFFITFEFQVVENILKIDIDALLMLYSTYMHCIAQTSHIDFLLDYYVVSEYIDTYIQMDTQTGDCNYIS